MFQPESRVVRKMPVAALQRMVTQPLGASVGQAQGPG